MFEHHPQKSFKVTATHKDTLVAVEAEDLNGYDLGFAGIILLGLIIVLAIYKSNRS